MSEGSLFPAYYFVRLHSIFAPHTMTIPTRAWNPLAGTNGFGGFQACDSSDADADDMINALVTKLSFLQSSEIVYDDWTIFTKADKDAPAIPRATNSFTAQLGQDGTPGYFRGVQFTYTFFDTEFNKSKLVILDASSNNDFTKRHSYAEMSADEKAVVDVFTLDSWAFQSRKGFRPATVLSLTKTINDSLRREYRDT